jgi:hypothetical protein
MMGTQDAIAAALALVRKILRFITGLPADL